MSETREIGFLFGHYKRLSNEFSGVLTGKGFSWGGSRIRPEATGYGAVYFAEEMLGTRSESIEGKTCLVSGSGNVAQYTVEKLLDLNARPITLSDSSGFIHDPDGIDREKLAFVFDLKNVRRGRISEYAERFPTATFTTATGGDSNPLWDIPADCAFPSATQNEINGKDAANLVNNGAMLVAEGANMPTAPTGIDCFLSAGILFGPGKAANAGGVAVSGLEMAQDSQRLQWSRDRGRRPASLDHATHPLPCPRGRRAVRPSGRLRGRREHRRLREGRRRHARRVHGLNAGGDAPSGSYDCSQSSRT